MSVSKIAGVILGSAALVAGHGYVTGAVVDGTYYGGYLVSQYPYETNPPETIAWSEDETDLGFIDGTGYATPNIICHKDAKSGALSAPVKAGGSVELQWTDWPSSHHGPVITYLANCNGDCSTVDKTALKFFKIDAGGLIDDSQVPGTWASDKLISNNNSRTITIPSTIESGNYVLRHEIIALHSAENKDGAQNYPQCLNLKVTGGGSDSPSGTLGTELYKDTDPGILVNIYESLSSYTIPGPALYTGSSSGSATTAAATTAAASTVASIAPISSLTPVSASPIRSPSAIPHFRNSTRLPLGSGPATTRPKFTAPAGPKNPPPSAALTVTNTATATADVTVDNATVTSRVTDHPAFQAPSTQTAGSVTVTTSAGGQSAQSTSTPNTGSGSTGTTTTTSTPEASDYSSSDWTSYLSSLSAEQVLSLLRQTFKWLATDKKHARDLSSLTN